MVKRKLEKFVMKLNYGIFGFLFIILFTFFCLNITGANAFDIPGSTQDKLLSKDYQDSLRESDSFRVKVLDSYKSYNSSEKTIKIEDSKYETIIELKLLTNYRQHVIVGNDSIVARLNLIDFLSSSDNLFDSIDSYNSIDNYKSEQKVFKLKYRTNWIQEKSYVEEILDDKTNETTNGSTIYYNVTRFNWTEFTTLDELPHKNIEIGIFTDTILGEEIEWIPTIKEVEILEYASYLVDGLYAYYNFDNDYTDSLGNYNGTNSGTIFTPGKINNGTEFTSDHIALPIDMSQFSAFSYSFWHKSNTPGADQAFIGSLNGEISFYLQPQADQSVHWFFDDDGNFGADFDLAIGAGNFTVGEWTHIAGTWDGSTVKLYQNGEFMINGSYTSFLASSTNLYLGLYYQLGTRFYSGEQDEIGIWNVELNQSQITELYRNGFGNAYPFADYTLNITSPTTASPESVTGEDNISINFDFQNNGDNITSGVTMNNVTIDGNISTIITNTIPASFSQIEYATWENDWEGWTDGGTDAILTTEQSLCGSYSIELSDDSGDGYTEKALDFSGYDYANVNFSLYVQSNIDSGECIFLTCDGVAITDWGSAGCTINQAGSDAWYDASARIDSGDCDFETNPVIRIESGSSQAQEEFFIDCMNISSSTPESNPQEFEYINGTGWQVNVTVPSGSTGLVDLFLNATYSGGTQNDTQSNSVDYGGADSTDPTWSLNQTNNTVVSLSTLFSILWDDNIELDPNGQYIFSTNNTGLWVNESAINFTTTPSWANVTKTLNDTVGVSVGYRWFATDNASNFVATDIFSLIVTSANTCSYTSGNWAIDCSDNCVIVSNVDVGGNDISIIGTGTFMTTANISNFGRLLIKGTDSSNICTATCSQGGCFK